MTKEELEKEAKEWIKDHSGLIGSYEFVKYDYDSMQKAYLAGAEPREKRISNLEDKLANADYQLEGRDNEIRELKAQIEKMINEIDKTMVLSNMRECEICDIQDIFRKYGFKRNSNDIWEIKEK